MKEPLCLEINKSLAECLKAVQLNACSENLHFQICIITRQCYNAST